MSMLASVPVETVAPVPRPLEQDFEALDACHREVLVTLGDLQKLVERLEDHGVDPVARRLASDIVRFFSQTARAHHAEEERLVFPGLLASGDAELVQHIQRLQQDHGWLEEDWLELSAQVDAVAQGYSWYDLDALRMGSAIFAELYKDHIDLEESLIYPEARRLMSLRPDAGAARARRAQR
ncbi:MAG: hypothetical protein QG612_1301 [Pseudomonadota bacterium]|nr:hypothetical protein [Pseudomonadota bacterium]